MRGRPWRLSQSICSTDTAHRERSGVHPWRLETAGVHRPFAAHPHMSAGSKDKVFAFDPRDLRQAQPRLNRHQDERVIASSEPGMAVGGGEQSIDFRAREEADECARKALAGDGQDTLDLRRVGWQLERGVAKERMNSSQP